MSTHFDDHSFSPGDWVSQVEAARIRGVSKQAIGKLIKKGRLRTLQIGSHTLVYRPDVETFVPKRAGRPKTGVSDESGGSDKATP